MRCIARLDNNQLFQCTKVVPPFIGHHRGDASGRTWATCRIHQKLSIGPYYKLSKDELNGMQTASRPLTNSSLKKYFKEMYCSSCRSNNPKIFNRGGTGKPYTKNVYDHLVKKSALTKTQKKQFKDVYSGAFTEERTY